MIYNKNLSTCTINLKKAQSTNDRHNQYVVLNRPQRLLRDLKYTYFGTTQPLKTDHGDADLDW